MSETALAGAPAIESVVFDIGNVLIDWDPRYLYRPLFAGDTAAMEYFLSSVCTPEWNRQMDAGKPFADCAAELQAEFPDHGELISAWHGRWPETLGGAIDGTVEVLARVRDRGYPLYAITNWSAENFPYARRHFPFLEWFDDIVVSGEVGLVKPDHAIYRLLIKRHRLNPRTAVFIDDSKANLEAAHDLGFPCIHFVDPAALSDDLKARGVL